MSIDPNPPGPPPGLPFGEAWIRAYFAEVDRMDPDGLLAWYADDGSFRFGNRPPTVGKPAIAAVLRAFYGSIRAMRHEATGVWADKASGVFEAEVAFTAADGRQVTVPAVSTMRLRGGRVADFRMVMDAAPLVQGAAR